MLRTPILTVAIATTVYAATDDEDDVGAVAVVLTLSGTDAAAFSLLEGVVTFKALPNFEAPKDAGKDNVYNITVVATDSDGQTDEMDVIVTVTNVEEDGTVTLSPLQPRIGSLVTATLSDVDGAVSDVKWKWARSHRQEQAEHLRRHRRCDGSLLHAGNGRRHELPSGYGELHRP